jgi:transcriptional antiterminator NusG
MMAEQSKQKMWYAVQAYSGQENSVKVNLERRIESMQMEEKIFQVVIPEEIQQEKRSDGTTKERLIKIYPGYVFIEMIVTDDSWFVVRNTPGVTGFLGSSGGGTKPIPLPQKKSIRFLKEWALSKNRSSISKLDRKFV